MFIPGTLQDIAVEKQKRSLHFELQLNLTMKNRRKSERVLDAACY